MTTRRDSPHTKIGPNLVAIPHTLQVNQMTLAEHQKNNMRNGHRPLTETEARLMGYSDEEIVRDLHTSRY